MEPEGVPATRLSQMKPRQLPGGVRMSIRFGLVQPDLSAAVAWYQRNDLGAFDRESEAPHYDFHPRNRVLALEIAAKGFCDFLSAIAILLATSDRRGEHIPSLTRSGHDRIPHPFGCRSSLAGAFKPPLEFLSLGIFTRLGAARLPPEVSECLQCLLGHLGYQPDQNRRRPHSNASQFPILDSADAESECLRSWYRVRQSEPTDGDG